MTILLIVGRNVKVSETHLILQLPIMYGVEPFRNAPLWVLWQLTNTKQPGSVVASAWLVARESGPLDQERINCFVNWGATLNSSGSTLA